MAGWSAKINHPYNIVLVSAAQSHGPNMKKKKRNKYKETNHIPHSHHNCLGRTNFVTYKRVVEGLLFILQQPSTGIAVI